jgi:hypothetical protein
VSEKPLRRYTDLPALIYLLNERKITLLDPKSWDDQNDAYYLSLYKEKKDLSSVLALCFTQASETYHHWRVFASGSSGVCIRFTRSELLAAAKAQLGVRAKTVTYLTLRKIRDRQLRIRELPFLKRFAFEHEDEFRLLYESETAQLSKLDIPVPLKCIQRVTLSPWMHPSLVSHVKRTVRAIKGCTALEIVRSTLIGNAEWKRLGDGAA